MNQEDKYIYRTILKRKYKFSVYFSERYTKPKKATDANGPKLAGTQFETKIKAPRQAQEWSYSSHRESIGKALSSPGIRSNKKTHIYRGSSARMAGNVCANVDQIRRHGRFFYLARAALDPPTSFSKKLFLAIGE
ncbi:hypothetical protein [Absidia glauca]|uniref:Ndc10 domain-containing protein n=1 Tax=Absidia glauca TaxID=4829 RepID=A0A168RVM9_ABSGL|nr:hypothetical protein [Absidia glauca]